MVHVNDLRRAVNDDPNIRQEMFDYHFGNGFYGAMPQYNARIHFEAQMQQGPASQALLQAYIPEFDRVHPGWRPASGPGSRSQATFMSGAVKKGAAVAAGGLVALIASFGMEDSQAQDLLQAAAATCMVGGPLAVGVAYVSNLFRGP